MANNLVREQHLQALAETSQQYTLDIQSETIDLLTEAFQVASGSTALPVAGVSTLGMIKVGAGLSMASDTLNVTLESGETYTEATTLTAGLMAATDKAKLDNIALNANNFSLPVAGASTLGGVKVGAGLSMVGDTLTVNLSNLSLGSASSTVEGAFWLEDD